MSNEFAPEFRTADGTVAFDNLTAAFNAMNYLLIWATSGLVVLRAGRYAACHHRLPALRTVGH